jgi:SAM-dependent methyltransferase
MLKLCKRKLDAEPEDVKRRVSFVNADMRRFDLKSRFSLVTITFGPFNNLLSVEDQLSCLTCIHRHLKDGGRLVFDVFLAQPTELLIREETQIVANQPPFLMTDDRSVVWGLNFHDVDYQRQIIHEVLTYEIRYPDGREERLLYPSDIRFYFRYEVEHLLARAGFAVEVVYGDFDKTPFGEKPPGELIFVARKKEGLRT